MTVCLCWCIQAPFSALTEPRYLARASSPDGIDQLKDRLRAFSREVATNDGWKNEDRVRTLLASRQLLGRDASLRASARPTKEE